VFPVLLVLILIGVGFGALALIQIARRPKERPPSRALPLVYATLGMLCFIAAGVLWTPGS